MGRISFSMLGRMTPQGRRTPEGGGEEPLHDVVGGAGEAMARRSLPPLAQVALGASSGLLYALGFVDPRLGWTAWFCFLPLLWVLREVRGWKRALTLSWTMGLAAHLFAYPWLVHMLREFAHLPVPLAILGYLLLCLAQAGNIAAVGFLAWAMSRRSLLSLGMALPLAILVAELLYPLLFPSYLANGQLLFPLVTQIADLGGVSLVSALIAWVNGALFELLAPRGRRPWRFAAGATAALVASLIYGQVRIGQVEALEAAAPKLKTAIVQANVGAANKHASAEAGIRRYRRMTDEAMRIPGVGLVVWPESGLNRAVPEDVTHLEGVVASRVRVPMIVGAIRVRFEERRKVWNSALALGPGGEIQGTYDKTKLLAFGEYVPGDSIFPGIYELLPYTARFERGQSLAPLGVGPWQLSTDICYEDVIPGFIRSLMGPIDDAGTRPHAMVNLTNDSWYGPKEPPIHLALATFRSIEHRRWLIRSTATGISAFIDGAGRIVRSTGFETEELLVEDVPMITGGPTVYGRIGDLFPWLATLFVAGLLFVPGRWRLRGGSTSPPQASPPR